MTHAKRVQQDVDALHHCLQCLLHFTGESPGVDFYISSLTEHNPYHSTQEILDWLQDLNKEDEFHVERMPLPEMRQWKFNEHTGDLEHDSGAFFKIRGLEIHTNAGAVPHWTQPIIHQPEIGVLGIITKKIDGILYFLMQAKAEPGNINHFQLSPTVQATRSNYLRRHGGNSTLYIEHFFDKPEVQILVDQLQSEQGSRFFHKRNRNIIVRVPDNDPIEAQDKHRWMTLGQILQIAKHNNTLNMSSRSVLSAIHFGPEKVRGEKPVNTKALKEALENTDFVTKPINNHGIQMMASMHSNSKTLHTLDDILMKITHDKFNSELEARLIPLKDVRHWRQTPMEIHHEDNKFFSVIGVSVKTIHREVASWDQPIIQQHDPGIAGFLTKEIEGIPHFLVQLKLESGVMDLLEMAPTVQCITGSYTTTTLPPHIEHFTQQKDVDVIINTYQSEEGGRFFEESNQNLLLASHENLNIPESSQYIWMTLHQMKHFIKYNNFLNIEARSLLSCLSWR